ncbi:hypothetical protein E2562_036585 [Oryza meyeriana var. granulata]|uniref:Uncharacterized protein n=2 Tax=Oryza meyeriana var. granulata TaxID=110450 RepID=A0A6G1ETE6_9ORYZ|nr:hypothetical protein E2562_036585 [Oryza meyeriana var. granulata]
MGSRFKEVGMNLPFFEGQVKALHHCGSFIMKVDFNDLEKHDEHNARYIFNNIPRIFERLRCCVCNFLLKLIEFKMKSTEVLEKTTLEIRGLPRPNSRLPFRKFAMENDMHKTWELFDFGCKKVDAPTYLGRKAGLGYLNFLLKKHKAGCCWDGSFGEEDMEVLIHDDGCMEFVITKKGYEDFTKEKGIADFNKFCEIIFPYFMSAEVKGMPAYFDQLTIFIICLTSRIKRRMVNGRSTCCLTSLSNRPRPFQP